MKVAKFFLGSLIVVLIGMLVLHWFVPTEDIEFGIEKSSNFSLNGNKVLMQFYENMRFPENKISYSISDACSIKKKYDMRWAFNIIENKTILEFYELGEMGQIIVDCDNKNRIENGLFIAGEGGPTNITKGENFNVILNGQILLIKESECERPNVAVHELLHVLGFNHSDNPNNIMYPISKCTQILGDEIPSEIDRLYSVSSLPDLMMRDVSAKMHGRYLDLNISIFNDGLRKAEKSKLIIYADDKKIKQFELNELNIGTGINMKLTNLLLTKIKIEKLNISLESDMTELSLENNRLLLTKI